MSDSNASTLASRDAVRAWRPPGIGRVIVMDGVVSSHAADPVAEYTVGMISGRATTLIRGRRRHLLRPGSLAVVDPSLAHRGVPAEDGPWRCRLMVFELPDIQSLLEDPDGSSSTPLEFPDPAIPDRSLAQRFVALHRLMTGPASTLERQSALAAWWQDAAAHSPVASSDRRTKGSAHRAMGLQRALNILADTSTMDVSLAELGAAAGLSPYQLVRAFRDAFGIAPHAFQIAQRVLRARRLLEAGVPPSEAAVSAGFFDQSHLHRHFRRRLGLTPAEYAAAFGHTAISYKPT